jgi:apolipoprotein N-acyltransferase
LAGAAQAASIAWPSNGQALGWLQVLSLTLLAAGLARMARFALSPFNRGREAHSLKHAAWFGGVFATAWLAGSFWWLYVSMHQVGGLPAPLAVLAVLALAAALALYYAAASAVWVSLARGLVAERPGLASALFAAVWTLAELMRGRWLTGFP